MKNSIIELAKMEGCLGSPVGLWSAEAHILVSILRHYWSLRSGS